MHTSQKTQKNWLQISITTDPSLVEAISDFLVGVTGAGVEIGVDDHLDKKSLNAYLEQENLDEETTRGLLDQLSSHLEELAEIFQVDVPTFSVTIIEEEDWGSKWKKHFKPFSIVPGVVIAPTWEEYSALEGEKVIVMDPGMAFGTGHHATTKLTLLLLQETLAECGGHKVLDVGTGTGILGMAAVLMGAGSVLGIDNDPEATTAAFENVRINSLAEQMEVAITPLSSLTDTYSVVMANIIHDVLLEMANDLTRLTSAEGYLLLSGILHGEQEQNIINCFTDRDFELKEQKREQEWAALLFKKRPLG